MPEAGESALILFTSFLPTSLLSIFGVSLFSVGNFMGVLCIRAPMLHFIQAVGFLQTPVILPLRRRFRSVIKRYYERLSVCLSVCIEQLSSHFNFH